MTHDTIVEMKEDNFRKDYLIQLMAANARMRNLEANNTKNLLDLSLQFNLLSSVSSFVVVEKHSTNVEV